MPSKWLKGNTLGVLDYFGDENKNKYRNYFIRFRKAFATEEDFINCFPDDLQNIATEYYPILVEAFPNLLLKFNTKSSALANLKFLVRYNSAKWTRYKEIQDITIPDMFSNDVHTESSAKGDSTAVSLDEGKQSTDSDSNSANLNFNNDYAGDKDSPVDESKWKATKNLQDGSTNKMNNLTDSTTESASSQISNQSTTMDKKDTRYSPEGISQILDLVQEPNAWLMKTILLQMSAPVQINFEHYDDWRGDFE